MTKELTRVACTAMGSIDAQCQAKRPVQLAPAAHTQDGATPYEYECDSCCQRRHRHRRATPNGATSAARTKAPSGATSAARAYAAARAAGSSTHLPNAAVRGGERSSHCHQQDPQRRATPSAAPTSSDAKRSNERGSCCQHQRMHCRTWPRKATSAARTAASGTHTAE